MVRFLLRSFFPERPVSKRIGSYGEFLLDNKYVFSDFSSWSEDHNDGLDRLISESRGKGVVFDIGAHIGLVSLPVSKTISPAGVVYAFEPSAVNRRLLERHVMWNNLSNIKVVPAAVGDREDNDIPFNEYEDASGRNSLVVEADSVGDMPRFKDHNHRLYKSVSVRMVSIDSFCLRKSVFPDVIKIDVEGAEGLVLAGAGQTLNKRKSIILLSVHPTQLHRFGSNVKILRDQIKGLGYRTIHAGSGEVAGGELEFKEYLLIPEPLDDQPK